MDADESKTTGNEPPHDEGFEEGLSLEELSQTYARVLGRADSSAQSGKHVEAIGSLTDPSSELADDAVDLAATSEDTPVSPLSIVEAILFVGSPDGSATSASEIAGVIRGVSEAEVVDCVRQLNQQYIASEHAFAIVEHPDGFRLELCADLEPIRESFYGRARPITLNQAAIDCLALIAYQPGIARHQIEEQRGQPSGPILNQLVRRKLISIERKEQQAASEAKKGKIAHYFPTEKLLELAGLVSLEDLPQVEDLDMD